MGDVGLPPTLGVIDLGPTLSGFRPTSIKAEGPDLGILKAGIIPFGDDLISVSFATDCCANTVARAYQFAVHMPWLPVGRV